MMKRNYFLGTLLLALVGGMGSGCNNIDEPTLQMGEQRRMVTLSAQAEIGTGADSRVTFDDNSTGIALTWENGDEITVASESVDGTYSNSGDVPNVRDFLLTVASSTATFSGDIAEADTGVYYAFYPKAAEVDKASDWNKVPHASFDLSTQSGALDESLTYMAAFAKPDDLKAVSFPFSHLTTVLKITPTITGVSEGTTITDVKILGNSGSQAWLLQKGEYTIDGSNQIKISNGNYGSISITGECKTGTAFYCYLVGGDYDNLKITATVNGTAYCGDIIGSTATALKSGKAYTKKVEMELAYTYDASTDVYTPHTSAGLLAIVANHSDANITLADDIILPTGRAAGGTNWTPLTASSSEPYTGTFDGNGKTISGLVSLGSLIGYLGEGGVVKNLTLENCNMYQAAFVYWNEGGTIDNCTLKNSSVTGFWHPGGIVSFNNKGTISNCIVTGCHMSSTYGGVGGVAGENGSYGGNNKAIIQDCSLVGENTVDAYSFDGAGIVISNNHDGIVRGCSVSGNCNIKSNGTGTAGIASANYGAISYCFVSSCNISRKDGRTNSIAGIATGNSSTITACYVYGVTTNDNAPLVTTANIIGYSGTNATVTDCYYVAAESNAVYSFDNSETPVDWATALSAMNAASNDYVWGGDSYDSATLTKKSK